MGTCFNAHCIVVCRGQTTYCAQKWVISSFYAAGLLRTAVLNVGLETLNRVVFFGLLELHPNAAPGDINKAEAGRG